MNIAYLYFVMINWNSGYVLNSYDDVANRPSSKIHQTSRVDPVIYPSSNDTKVGREQLENGAMLSLALKIHNDTRQSVKVRQFFSVLIILTLSDYSNVICVLFFLTDFQNCNFSPRRDTSPSIWCPGTELVQSTNRFL